jgi:hypothetical protein
MATLIVPKQQVPIRPVRARALVELTSVES